MSDQPKATPAERMFPRAKAALREAIDFEEARGILGSPPEPDPRDAEIARLRAETADLARGWKEANDRAARLRAALAGMVRWFGKYPEFIPNPEALDKVEAAITEAKAALG